MANRYELRSRDTYQTKKVKTSSPSPVNKNRSGKDISIPSSLSPSSSSPRSRSPSFLESDVSSDESNLENDSSYDDFVLNERKQCSTIRKRSIDENVLTNSTRSSPYNFIPQSARNPNFGTESDENKSNNILIYIIISVSILVGALIVIKCTQFSFSSGASLNSIDQLKSKFSSQDEDLWNYLEVAVNEIVEYNKPQSIIFVHEDKKVDDLFRLISDYANSKIIPKSEHKKPVVYDGNYLNEPEFRKDYGKIITEIKERLDKSAVVIIKNLDKIRGTVPLAFHSFCDEYNPIHNKVLFLFTIKVNSIPANVTKFIEEILRKNWIDINDDKFYPLFTRISSIILTVK